MTDFEARSPFDAMGQHARMAMFFARESVSQTGGTTLEDAHLLLGVIKAHTQAVARFVEPSQWTRHLLETRLRDLCPPGPMLPTSVEIPFSAGAKRAIALAAGRESHPGRDIVPEHLVWALMDDPSTPVAGLLAEAGVTREAIEAFLDQA